MKTAIMQPYIFPYIGYFQLINSVDNFIFYDDVHYIKKGWINRNQILVNNKAQYFTIPVIKASQNKLINEINIDKSSKDYDNILITIKNNYKKAPFYDSVIPIIEDLLQNRNIVTISDLAIQSILKVLEYLEINKKIFISSQDFSESKGIDKADRLIRITKESDAQDYINAIGGTEIYNKDYFNEHKINLLFLKPNNIPYKQFNNKYLPWLSIIDILMFNPPKDILKMLDQYELI
ncbi:MAG: WbqC family protein [Candidatus Chryseobacterium colombiense]|nr:WbqC family protein [Chryseobacterium sp.]WEK69119.1 MAG: WbqC family protein [Chryseobacterium sp.]